jgi:hypothetical protein
MADLAERLQAVEDRLAIIELEGTYARSFDDHDGDAWAALFTADGIYQSRVLGETADPATYVQGTEQLRRFCTDAPFRGIHFLHLPQLTLRGDTAIARIHLEFHGAFTDAGAGAPLTKLAGYYDVAYERRDDRWLIARRVTTAFARESRATFGYVPGRGLDP